MFVRLPLLNSYIVYLYQLNIAMSSVMILNRCEKWMIRNPLRTPNKLPELSGFREQQSDVFRK
jgi:hypothetical protein